MLIGATPPLSGGPGAQRSFHGRWKAWKFVARDERRPSAFRPTGTAVHLQKGRFEGHAPPAVSAARPALHRPCAVPDDRPKSTALDRPLVHRRPGRLQRPRRRYGGLLVYGPRTAEGYEYACDIARAHRSGARTDITLRCQAEGRTSIQKETVEVVDGRLRRTIKVEGKIRTGEYRRCP